MSDSKRYDEKAVSQILRRAAELEQGGVRGGGGGLTRADIERVAAEAGLDPAAVRAAIAEQGRAPEPTSGILGGPLRVRLERVVEAELDGEGVGEVLDLAQHELGMSGRWYRNGRVHTWSPKGVARKLQVRIQRREGRTELLVDERLNPLAGGIWGGLFGGLGGAWIGVAMGVGLGALHSVPAMLGLLGAGLAGTFFLARTLYSSASATRSEALVELADRLAAEGRAVAETMVRAGPAEAEEHHDELPRGREPRRRDRDDESSRRKRGRRRSRD